MIIQHIELLAIITSPFPFSADFHGLRKLRWPWMAWAFRIPVYGSHSQWRSDISDFQVKFFGYFQTLRLDSYSSQYICNDFSWRHWFRVTVKLQLTMDQADDACMQWCTPEVSTTWIALPLLLKLIHADSRPSCQFNLNPEFETINFRASVTFTVRIIIILNKLSILEQRIYGKKIVQWHEFAINVSYSIAVILLPLNSINEFMLITSLMNLLE